MLLSLQEALGASFGTVGLQGDKARRAKETIDTEPKNRREAVLTWVVCAKPCLPGWVSRAQEVARQRLLGSKSAPGMGTGYWLDFIKPQAGGSVF